MSFWRNIFRRRKVEQDLNDELMAYVEEVTERHLRAGMTADAAREAALLEVGGLDGLKQQIRQQHIGIRGLRKLAAFAGVAVVFFSAGIGSTLAVTRWKESRAQSTHTETSAVKSDASVNRVPRYPSNVMFYTSEGNAFAEVSSSIPICVGPNCSRWPSLEGLLSEKKTQAPLANVEVTLVPAPPPPVLPHFTRTDEYGRFNFNALPGSTFRLIVKSRGVDIPINTRAGAVSVAVPTDAPYSVSVTRKDGTQVEGHNPEKLKLTGIVSFGKPSTPGFLPSNFRILEYDKGTVELKIPNQAKP